EKGSGETGFCRFARLDRWWKLVMIACEDDATRTHDWNPTRGLQRLRRFVDEDRSEGTRPQQRMGRANEGTRDDVAIIEQVIDDVKFQHVGVGFQRLRFPQQHPPPALFGIAILA